MPWRPNTYRTNPLQSNPDGSLPPLRYGVPVYSSAVPASAPASPAGTGADGGRVEVPAGVPAPGNGRGVAPVDAHPPATAARHTINTTRRMTPHHIGRSCRIVQGRLPRARFRARTSMKGAKGPEPLAAS